MAKEDFDFPELKLAKQMQYTVEYKPDTNCLRLKYTQGYPNNEIYVFHSSGKYLVTLEMGDFQGQNIEFMRNHLTYEEAGECLKHYMSLKEMPKPKSYMGNRIRLFHSIIP